MHSGLSSSSSFLNSEFITIHIRLDHARSSPWGQTNVPGVTIGRNPAISDSYSDSGAAAREVPAPRNRNPRSG